MTLWRWPSIQGNARKKRSGRTRSFKSVLMLVLLLMIHSTQLYLFYLFRDRLDLYILAATLAIDALICILFVLWLAKLKERHSPAQNYGEHIGNQDSIPSRNGQLEEKMLRLQAANNGLEDFTLTISHEIKAPVRAIDGYARIFVEDYGSRLDEEALDVINNIRSICKDTLALINKLLEYTRIADEEPDKEIVPLQELISLVFDELVAVNPNGEKMSLVFESSIPPVIGDRLLLKLAIQNILSNAVKFTRDIARPVITAGCRKEGEYTVFYITDNGAGFDMQFSQKLFGLFQRMHNNDEFEGSGLGLVIVKKVILKHNGRVWITSEVGEGTTIYFTLDPKDILDVE